MNNTKNDITMKTSTLFLAALAFGLFNPNSINAGSGLKGLKYKNNDKKLAQTIESLFKDAPLEDLMYIDERCTLHVKFKIDENNQITDINIDGDNRELVRYANAKLSHNSVAVNSTFEQRTYAITLQFILK